jgi:hypothetical protein
MTTLSGIITPSNVLTDTSTNTVTNKTLDASSNTITNVSLSTGVTGTLPVANGGTGATTLTAENVILGDGTSAVKFVAPGTSGNVLTSDGTTWASTAPAGGGSLVFLSTTTGTAAATIDVETTFDSTYNMYMLVGELVYPSTNAQYLLCRFKLGTYLTASYETIFQGWTNTTTSSGTSPSAATSGSVFYNLKDNEERSASFVMYIPFPSSLTRQKNVYWQGVAQQNGSTAQVQGIINQNDASSATTALTGLRFLSSSGNLNGTFRLYGIKNS